MADADAGMLGLSTRLLVLLVALLCTWTAVDAQPDVQLQKINEVVGEPLVNCAADAIYVKLRTNATFTGHVDVKYTPNRLCFQSLVTNNQIELLIPHEECSVVRRRSLHPSGVILEASVAVAFHGEFTTVDDRVFNVRCFHQKKTNANDSTSLFVGSPQLPPPDQTGPSCSYDVLNGDGDFSTRVALGETVLHHWSCRNVYESCVRVENCELVAGSSRHEVIDGRGCSVYTDLLPQLVYHNRTSVSVNVSVFGVSNSPLVYFACQLRLHPSSPSGECPIPQCGPAVRKTRSPATSSLPVIDVRSQNIEISQIISARPGRLPAATFSAQDPTATRQPPTTCVEEHVEELKDDVGCAQDDKICLDVQSAAFSVAIIVAISAAVVSAAAAVLLRRRHYEIAALS